MKNRTRYWVRRILFLVLIGLVGFALYQSFNRENAGKPIAGEEAPNFTLTDVSGKEVELTDLRGKAVMLNFWGTWCEPCRTEMPAMQQMYQKYQAKGFEIVAVNIAETEVAVNSFAKQHNLTFPIWMDQDRDVVKQYKIGPLPSSLFLDRNGVIVDRIEGPLDPARLEYYILNSMKEKE
ncbi:thiol-disulfide oxidoreductase ResA [Risungbinella massiliensis]|uniref:thiol-disulfide oxidoreductase ResA n=1 Tax=Risungbinella massiliensis TaxID=1329796 RepID=UPI0005CBE9FA|nr:thiol-disulfide oxidoreductase ResA [Risungbinella massiliensis]